ncbi:MAG: hypothetical protein JWM16_1020 [Verrucomicrobiales bacterium]|nr:hypothetical protein [Verrucomicrobiales bacterium]
MPKRIALDGWKFWEMAGVALLCCAALCTGCARKKAEPRITGSSSDAATSLQCAWKPGLRYIVRLEMNQFTDPEVADRDVGQHRVNFAQECQIDVKPARKEGSLNAEMTILSLSMERSKGNEIAVSFDSEPGWEPVTEEDHYTTIMRQMVGGKLSFLISPDGKVQNSQGVPQWLNKAFAADPRPAGARGGVTAVVSTNGTTNIVRRTVAAGGGRDKRTSVVNVLRNFFSPEHFRQIFEFSHLPANPVRVGESWASQGITFISGRGTSRYETKDEFVGWQLNSNSNCARINIAGDFMPMGLSLPANKKGTFKGHIWVNTGLGFPMTQVFEKQGVFPDPSTLKQMGTNTVATPTNGTYKAIQQSVSITLVDVLPLEENAKAATETK